MGALFLFCFIFQALLLSRFLNLDPDAILDQILPGERGWGAALGTVGC